MDYSIYLSDVDQNGWKGIKHKYHGKSIKHLIMKHENTGIHSSEICLKKTLPTSINSVKSNDNR